MRESPREAGLEGELWLCAHSALHPFTWHTAVPGLVLSKGNSMQILFFFQHMYFISLLTVCAHTLS